MKINDIVYYVNDYKVIKCIIDAIIIKEDRTGTQTLYTISPYKKKEAKSINCVAANLVKDLEIAKISALENWKKITQDVHNQLAMLSDNDFEN